MPRAVRQFNAKAVIMQAANGCALLAQLQLESYEPSAAKRDASDLMIAYSYFPQFVTERLGRLVQHKTADSHARQMRIGQILETVRDMLRMHSARLPNHQAIIGAAIAENIARLLPYTPKTITLNSAPLYQERFPDKPKVRHLSDLL